MANLTKSFHNSIIATILAFTTLVFYSCEKEPQLTNPNDEAQIELMVVSAKASSDSPKSKTLSFSSKHNYSKKQPFVRNIDILLRTIDRVTVSVINSSGVAVINERELTIVETEQGRFAEGTLSIPVNEPSETFRIDVKAFENENLVLAGARQIILTPGEIREEPVAVIIRPLGTGDIQITLTWNTATDQDLHVIDPTGFRIFFEDTLSPTGGELDFDDIDGFGPENIFWPPGGAPNGRYKVQVVYYSGSEVTDVTVVVRRSDAETRTFTGTLAVEKDTLDVTEFTFAGGSPGGAVISNVNRRLVELNSPQCDFEGVFGSLFEVSFDYSDPDGDVTAGTVINVSFVFSPSGTSGSFTIPNPTITGNGFSGTITGLECYIFRNDSSVDVTVSITDAGANTSNSLTATLQRPQGANVPPSGGPNGMQVRNVGP